jgi:transcriptional regulator with XRE-family HTH domain
MAMSTTYTLGAEIRVARIRSGRAQAEVASAADISPQYLNDIETERRIPPPRTLDRLARTLGLDRGELCWLWCVHHLGPASFDVLAHLIKAGKV